MKSQFVTRRVRRYVPASSISAFILAFSALPVAAQSPPPADEDAAMLDTVSVTGTLLRGIAPTSTNVVGITRDDIQVLSKGSPNDLLATTPQVNVFNTAPSSSAELGNPVIRPTIRGLRGGTTLMLMNGQRMVGSGVLQTTPDLWVIPVAVLERVEVMTDGGSATYGSDAIGGVINFITRRRFDGVEVSSRYGTASGGYWQMDNSLTMGRDWGSGSALLSYTYVEHDNLPARKRSYMRSDHRDRGGDDFRVLNCARGNVIVGEGANAVTWGISDDGFAAPNRCDENQVIDFYPRERRNGIFGVLTQQLNDRLTFDATVYWSQRFTQRNGISTRDGTGLHGRGTITSANPWFRPVGTETEHRVEFSLAPAAGRDTRLSPQKFTSKGITPTLTWSFGDDWQLKLSGNYGHSISTLSTRQVNAGAISTALAGTMLDTALNPYDVTLTNPALLPVLLNYEFYGWAEQEHRSARAVADGTMFSLPAGDVKLAVGAEHTYESIDAMYGQGLVGMPSLERATADRNVWSIFAEMMVPVIADSSRVGALDLSLSVRHDRYNDVGNTTNPKIGLTWYPLDYLRVRANWGTSFHAPSLGDTAGAVDTRAQVLNNSPYRQPGSPNSDLLRPTILLAGGSLDLQPEEADTWSLGFDWTPAGALDGLSASVTYYNIKFTNAIQVLPFREVAMYINPGYSRLWTINPTLEEALAATAGMWVENAPDIASLYAGNTPPYVIIDARRKNLGGFNLTGLDFNLGYTRAAGPGDLLLNLGGTYGLKRDVSATAGSPMISEVHLSSRYTAMASIGYQLNDFRTQLLVRNNDGYIISAGSQTRISSFTVADLSLGWDINRAGWWSDTMVTINIDNVLDRNPPFRNNADGYGNGSTLGRLFIVGINKKF